MPAETLTALRTKAEIESRHEFDEAFVIPVHTKRTARTLQVIDGALKTSSRHGFAHLRRVIASSQLPTCVQRRRLGWEASANGSSLSFSDETDQATLSLGEKSSATQVEVHVLLCRTSAMSRKDVCSLLVTAKLCEFEENEFEEIDSRLYTVQIPLSTPLSKEEAAQHSSEYWPTIYKKHNPHGPQHNAVNDAADKIRKNVGNYMALASFVGQATYSAGFGDSVGAVIVERNLTGVEKVLAVAGDARFYGSAEKDGVIAGNPLAHAVMRAISMVARKRRGSNDGQSLCNPASGGDDSFVEAPVTPAEQDEYSKFKVQADGYLCLRYEIYITHEPCIMCCMALVHSRFGKVVFGTSMTYTGGLIAQRQTTTASPALGYGLFWHPSLNWQFLVFQYVAEDAGQDRITSDQFWHT